MKKQTLTDIQSKTHKFILDFIAKRNESPRLKDISEKFKISSGAANDRIETLIKKGWIKKDKNNKIKQ